MKTDDLPANAPLLDEQDLKSLERITYSRRFSDGSMDVFFGLGVLLVGIMWMLDLVAVGAAIPAMLVPLWVLVQKRVIEPRAGYSEPAPERKRVERSSLWLTVILGGILFVQIVMAIFGKGMIGSIPQSVVDIFLPGLPAALIALMAFLGGLITHQKEGAHYAMTLLAIGIIGGMNALEPGPIIAIGGVLILLVAVRKFGRFLKGNPPVQDDRNDDV